jgi:hypothetical protein
MSLEGLRILSGLIIPDDDALEGGSVEINFNPHDVRGSGDTVDPFVEDIQAFGPAGPFITEPNKTVSLREISATLVDDSFSGNIGFEEFQFGLHDEFIRDRRSGQITGLTVEWETSSRVFSDDGGSRGPQRREIRSTPVEIREISYLIIGEVDEDATDEDYEGERDVEDR